MRSTKRPALSTWTGCSIRRFSIHSITDTSHKPTISTETLSTPSSSCFIQRFQAALSRQRRSACSKCETKRDRTRKFCAWPQKDPRYNNRKSINDLNEHTLKEIIHFFEVYKQLEEKDVDVIGWNDVALAIQLIEKYRTDN